MVSTTNIFRPLILLADILSKAGIPYTTSPGFVAADRDAFAERGPAAIKKAGWEYTGTVFLTLEKDEEDNNIVLFEDRVVTKALDEEIARRKAELKAAEDLKNQRGQEPDIPAEILHIHEDVCEECVHEGGMDCANCRLNNPTDDAGDTGG